MLKEFLSSNMSLSPTSDCEVVADTSEVCWMSQLFPGAVPVSQLLDDPLIGAQFHLNAVCSAQPDHEHAAVRLRVPNVARRFQLTTHDDGITRRQLDVHRVLTGNSSTTYHSGVSLSQQKYKQACFIDDMN